MNNTLIDKTKFWCDHNRCSLVADGLAVELSLPLDGGALSARVDLESSEIFGRVTIWESGLCDIEMIAVSSGDQILWKHLEDIDSDNIANVLSGFAQDLLMKEREMKKGCT
jgi:hypothetical protein